MDVKTAILKARETAKPYVGEGTSFRVEEVEHLDEEADWNIILSWELTPDSRVYWLFRIRGESPVGMEQVLDL
jgi:hypothetical protein